MDDAWSLWRAFLIKAAGFPVARVLEFANSEVAAAADELLEREQAAHAARAAAVATVGEMMTDPPSRPRRQLMQQLRAGVAPTVAENDPPALTSALATLRAVAAGRDAVLARLEAAYGAELVRASAATRAVARDPRYREALLWQNRTAVHTAVEPLLASDPDAHDSKSRQRERLVVNYAQRYFAKNDVIGFFGSAAWGAIAREGPAIDVRPGPELLARRRVFFEHWTIDALAQALMADPALRRWCAPRRMPLLGLDGDELVLPLGAGTRPLDPRTAAVLRMCDGEHAPRAIARALAADPASGVRSEDDVLAVLGELLEQNVIVWALEVPSSPDAVPEAALRRQLERVEDLELRARAIAPLDELEAARAAVARAAGDPAALDAALGAFEATFTRLTSTQASRLHGEMLAGRTPLLEDTRRDLAVTLGPELVARFARPLSLVLTGARWYCHERARLYRPALEELYERLCAERGTRVLSLSLYWSEADTMFARERSLRGPAPNVPESIKQFGPAYRARWAEILGVRGDERHVARRGADLEPAVRAAFAAPCPGWPAARYQCADVLFAARSVEELARGGGTFVLGGLRTGYNATENPAAFEEHEDPERLKAMIDRDVPGGRVTTVFSTQRVSRRFPTHLTRNPRDADVEFFANNRSARPREQVVGVGDATVSEVDGRLCVCARGRAPWDILEFAGWVLLETEHALLPPAPHVPRVSIDDLVVARETWRFNAAALTFASAKTPLERFVGARRWQREHGLPRYVFFRATHERKPTFLDLESPTFVELFAYHARKAETMIIVEMLPTVEQCWLPDAAGNKYSCEIRFVGVDATEWHAPSR